MSKEETKCPFIIGDLVRYKPSGRTIGLNAMTDLANLKVGQTYRIVDVVKDMYVVVEGFEDSPTGGLAWNEFERVE